MAERVEINPFMGTWYVHGCTPTFLDRDPHNATESYELADKGRIKTTYRFRKGSFEAEEKVMHPVGKVFNKETNAEWRMKFFGIFSAPYLILYVDSDYEYTLVGHPNRKMAWLMSRSPEIADDKYEELKQKLIERAYDLSEFVRVPQQWPEDSTTTAPAR
ncbi:MAG: lipocalin family protein [Verrucomicrobiae bacterium]|nr:lipocalin family protein [Verrucomicrobiae bacterium]